MYFVENLRQLRKWKKLVMKLRHETCTYIEEVLGMNDVSNSESDNVSKIFKFNTACPLYNAQNSYTVNKYRF